MSIFKHRHHLLSIKPVTSPLIIGRKLNILCRGVRREKTHHHPSFLQAHGLPFEPPPLKRSSLANKGGSDCRSTQRNGLCADRHRIPQRPPNALNETRENTD